MTACGSSGRARKGLATLSSIMGWPPTLNELRGHALDGNGAYVTDLNSQVGEMPAGGLVRAGLEAEQRRASGLGRDRELFESRGEALARGLDVSFFARPA